jgi:hypothetical protein
MGHKTVAGQEKNTAAQKQNNFVTIAECSRTIACLYQFSYIIEKEQSRIKNELLQDDSMTSQEKDPKTTKKSPLKESVSERLESLNADPRRSQIGLLAENLVAIEKALSRGIPRVVVWEGLREEGLTLTFLSFETCLQRLRKRNAAQGITQTSSPASHPPNSQPSPKPSLAVPPPSQSVELPYKTNVTDKDREDYTAFLESIKHLPEHEQRKKTEQYLLARI